MTSYSNPRMRAEIADWPHGSHRTTATFEIEQTKLGERGKRITIDPKTGRPSKPKVLTYARKARIVDGDDGRTYIAELTTFGHISVMNGDMKYQHDTIFPEDERYHEIKAMFEVAA